MSPGATPPRAGQIRAGGHKAASTATVQSTPWDEVDLRLMHSARLLRASERGTIPPEIAIPGAAGLLEKARAWFRVLRREEAA